jgi:hypothetical protein
MIRRTFALLPGLLVLAACSSATPRATGHAEATLPAATATPTAAAAGLQRTPGSTGAPSHTATASATPAAAGHTGHVAPVAANGPAALHPPAAGTYMYTQTNDSGTQTVNLAVSPLQGNSDSLTWHASSGSQTGQLDATLSWPGSGMLVAQIVLQNGTTSYTCAMSPPVEAEASPLAAGTAWSSDSTCPVAGGTVRWTEKDHVTGADTVQVGGVPVFTYLVAVSRTITFANATYSITSATSASSWFAPSLGLEVRNQSTTTSTSGGQSKTSTSTMQLESTRPQ